MDLPSGSHAADFYAIAYDWGGETVISYRGTDDWGLPASAAQLLMAGSPQEIINAIEAFSPEGDPVHGMPLAVGDYLASQAVMAREFFQAVGVGQVSPQAGPQCVCR